MEKKLRISDEIEANYFDDIAVIKLESQNVFQSLVDLERIGNFLSFYKKLADDKAIKVVVFDNAPNVLDEKSYIEFLSELSGTNKDFTNVHGIEDYENKVDLIREIVVLQRIIMKIIELQKITVYTYQGRMVSPFFGVSLAADFRFVTEDTVFLFEFSKYGLHPTGGVPFFLPRYVGNGKAAELLFTGKELTAQEALESGLITKILPKTGFYESYIEEARKLARMNSYSISITKRLLSSYKESLSKYFSEESKTVGLF